MSDAPRPTLILVEGLPGSGKSTTSQWIAHELAQRGRPARWVYEQEHLHPVLGPARVPTSSWKENLAHRLAAWAGFAAAVRSAESTTVLDSAFLQTPTFVLLRRGLPADTVAAFLDRVADIIRPLDPALVYFPQPEPEVAFRGIAEARGMAWTLQHVALCDASAWSRGRGANGMDGLVAYWREHAAVIDAAVARANLRTLIVDVRAADWPTRRRSIAEFLRLEWPPREAPADIDLSRFAGRYRHAAGREAHLSMRGGDLVVDRLLWFSNRLLPRAPGVFDAESWPYRLTFEAGPSGTVTRFRFDGPDLMSASPRGTYEKVT